MAGKTFQIQPNQRECDGSLPQGLSAGTMQIVLGDGSVRGVSAGVTVTTWHAAMTPNNGEPLGSDWNN